VSTTTVVILLRDPLANVSIVLALTVRKLIAETELSQRTSAMRRDVLGALLLQLEEHLGASSLLKMPSHLPPVQLTQLTQEHVLHQVAATIVGLKGLIRMVVKTKVVSGAR